MTYFMAGTQLAGVERLMREGGNCCSENHLRDQAAAGFFLTRISRKAADTYEEQLEQLKERIPDKEFGCRMDEMIRAVNLKQEIYHNENHKRHFELLKEYPGLVPLREKPAYAAGLFLLSADEKLWKASRDAVTPKEIHFLDIHMEGAGIDGYVLFHMARDFYYGTDFVKLSDLNDEELVEESIFRLIIHAGLIRELGLHNIPPCLGSGTSEEKTAVRKTGS